MAIEEKAIGGRVYYVDNMQEIAFTLTEMRGARDRYAKLVSKKIKG